MMHPRRWHPRRREDGASSFTQSKLKDSDSRLQNGPASVRSASLALFEKVLWEARSEGVSLHGPEHRSSGTYLIEILKALA